MFNLIYRNNLTNSRVVCSVVLYFITKMDFDAFEDDLEVLELIEVGIPRQIYLRADHFHDLPDLQFFQRFRLTKETVLYLLAQIEHHLEFPNDRYRHN